MQFLIIARDGTDEGALARRLAAREAHLASVKAMYADGRIIEGGAILDDEGRMVGSGVIAEFPDRAALDEWIQNDPYTKGGVWKDIEILPFRRAPR